METRAPRLVPEIDTPYEDWLEQRLRASSSTSIEERALEEITLDLLFAGARADDC